MTWIRKVHLHKHRPVGSLIWSLPANFWLKQLPSVFAEDELDTCWRVRRFSTSNYLNAVRLLLCVRLRFRFKTLFQCKTLLCSERLKTNLLLLEASKTLLRLTHYSLWAITDANGFDSTCSSLQIFVHAQSLRSIRSRKRGKAGLESRELAYSIALVCES